MRTWDIGLERGSLVREWWGSGGGGREEGSEGEWDGEWDGGDVPDDVRCAAIEFDGRVQSCHVSVHDHIAIGEPFFDDRGSREVSFEQVVFHLTQAQGPCAVGVESKTEAARTEDLLLA